MLSSKEASSEAIQRTGLHHRIYQPPHAGGYPLFVLVHGRAGDAKVMWLFSKAFEKYKPLTVSPQAPIADPLSGYSWWLIDAEVREASPSRSQTTDAQLTPAVEKLAHFIRIAKEEYGISEPKVIGLGFSQGGAVLSALSLMQPELFAGVAMLSSFVPSIALDYPLQESSTKYFFAHGTQDEIVALSHAENSVSALRARGLAVELHTDDVGHKVGTAGLRACGAWIATIVDHYV